MILTSFTQSSFPSSKQENWHIPNFETLRVLPKLIEFLGPLWVQATDIEEGLNKYSRQCLYVSNHKMAASNILQMVSNLKIRRKLLILSEFKATRCCESDLRWQLYNRPTNACRFTSLVSTSSVRD